MKWEIVLALVAVTNYVVCSATPASYRRELELLQKDPLDFATGSPVNATEDDCSCGMRRGKSEKIVGGMEADMNEFPWRCALYFNTSFNLRFFCGCSIVSKEWVMTAGHCTRASKGKPLFIDAGDHDLSTDDDTPNQMILVSEVHQHPEYDFHTYNNDISLLKLSKPLKFSDSVGPVCLPYKYKTEEFSKASVTASGWGTLREGDQATPTKLHKVDLPVLSTQECQPYFRPQQITENMLCTYKSGTDTCQGDSGGSIDYRDPETGRYFAIGVVSFGYGCARENKPGVYSKVANYADFIDKTIGASNVCRV